MGRGAEAGAGILPGASRAGLDQEGGRREDGDGTQRPPGACTRRVPLLGKNVAPGAGGRRPLTLVTLHYLHITETSDSGQANEQDSSASPKQVWDRAFYQIFKLR